jgi:hypothetical protein
MKYKTGQIYFIKSRDNLIGKLIDYYNRKKFGQSDATHCGIINDVNNEQVCIYEAGTNGFQPNWYAISWLDEMIKNGKVKLKQTKIKLNNVDETCDKYQDIGYGYLDILGIVCSFLFGWKVIGITGKNKMICSEAVCRVLYDCSNKKIDFEKEYGIKFDAISPEHLFLSKQLW